MTLVLFFYHNWPGQPENMLLFILSTGLGWLAGLFSLLKSTMTCFISGNARSPETGELQRLQTASRDLPKEEGNEEVLLSEGETASLAHHNFKDALY